MESRESRWRNQGLVCIGMLLLLYGWGTEPGCDALKGLLATTSQPTTSQQLNWVPFVALVVVFFASAAVGYIINSMTLCALCLCRRRKPGQWYSAEWKKTLVNTPFWDALRKAAKDDSTGDKLYTRLADYSEDTLLSYFWQRAPKSLVEWVSRRHDVYWTTRTTTAALILGIGIFVVVVLTSEAVRVDQLHWRRLAAAILLAVLICVGLTMHGTTARGEACEMIELWAFHKFEVLFDTPKSNSLPKLRSILDLAGKEGRSKDVACTGGEDGVP